MYTNSQSWLLHAYYFPFVQQNGHVNKPDRKEKDDPIIVASSSYNNSYTHMESRAHPIPKLHNSLMWTKEQK